MPQLFRIGSYWVYFWSNESIPLEPVHVHVSEGKPVENATKMWILKSGQCLVENNNSNIPKHILRNLKRIIEARSKSIIEKWYDTFGEVTYYC